MHGYMTRGYDHDRFRRILHEHCIRRCTAGNLTGAVNMLVDVTDEQSSALHQQADHCRRLAEATYDRDTAKILADMAAGFDRTASELEQKRPSS